MTQLSPAQQTAVAAYWAQQIFVVPNVTAIYSLDQISSAVAALDNAFDTTLTAAVAAVGGSTTIINGLGGIIPAPLNAATVAQKTLLACYVLMKRAGLI